MTKFDAKKFLQDHFTNPAGVLETYQRHKMTPPSRDAVEKWFQRGKIPGDDLAVLQAMLEIECADTTMRDYVK